MTDFPKRRGRPPGSRDSYPRSRTCKKLPPKTATEIVMPAVRELIDIAELNGYHRGIGRPNKRTQEGVARATTKLLAALRAAIDNENN